MSELRCIGDVLCLLLDSDKSYLIVFSIPTGETLMTILLTKIKFPALKIKLDSCINVNLSLMGYQSKMKFNVKRDKRKTFRD